ncbi:hypothetical protein FA15DRAFT_676465 [Coprinopsis marcescibilis]|uniref:Uncharacterized protein n=1 Tax=Coprinopsis marcescibilis TaxID=230819 RepID=A0A5C3KAC8_COPMA|nr:hypothetical protein FA15DRAFT_676465 [Coprinopsis marcescibilis]
MGPASPNISSLSLVNLIAYALANTLWEIFDLNEHLEPFIGFMRNLVNDGIQPLQPPECATEGCRQSGCSAAQQCVEQRQSQCSTPNASNASNRSGRSSNSGSPNPSVSEIRVHINQTVDQIWNASNQSSSSRQLRRMDASMPPPYGTQDRDYEIPVHVTEPIEESSEPGGVSI